jgi:hypothetical protein
VIKYLHLALTSDLVECIAGHVILNDLICNCIHVSVDKVEAMDFREVLATVLA